MPKKVQAIANTSMPKNAKQLCSFIGMINCCRDSWIQQSDVLAPSTELMGKKAKWNWTNVHDKAFKDTKHTVANEVLQAHPNFKKPFNIHSDASKCQSGVVISQDGKLLAHCSRKLNSDQLNHTTTECELSATVETLKEFSKNTRRHLTELQESGQASPVTSNQRKMLSRIIQNCSPHQKRAKEHSGMKSTNWSKLVHLRK